MAGTRELKVVILGDSSKAQRAFSQLERSGSTLGSKMDGLGSKVAGAGRAIAAAGLAAGAAAGAFGIKALKSASDLEEQMSKVGVVFGGSAKIVTAGADEMAKAFGTPKAQFLEAASAIGLVGKASGLAQGDAAKLGVRMAKLGIDASSFFNVPLEEALEKIRSGLVGEAEPLRAFGVLLSESALQAEAVAQGLGKGAADAGKAKAAIQTLAIAQRKAAEATKEFGADSMQAQKATLAVTKAENGLKAASKGAKVALTEQQKVQLRVAIIDRQMADAQGDRARTAGSFANRMRELKDRMENFSAAVGMRLLPIASKAFDLIQRWAPVVQKFAQRLGRELAPVVERVGDFIRNKLIPALQQFAGYITDTVLPALRGAWEFLRDRFLGAFNRVREALGENREGLKKLADFITTRVIPVLMHIAGVIVDVLGRVLTGLIVLLGHVTAAWDGVVGAMRAVVAFIVDKILMAFEWIATAAAKAFGWVPIIGPQLQAAARAIEKFRDDANAAILGIKDKTVAINFDSRIPSALSPDSLGYIPPLRPGEAGPPAPGQGRAAGPVINSYNTTVNTQTNASGAEIARELSWNRNKNWGRR